MSPLPSVPEKQDGEFVRVWGPGNLSEIECRILGIEPTGLKVVGKHPLAAPSTLYRKVDHKPSPKTEGPASAATDPGHVSTNPSEEMI